MTADQLQAFAALHGLCSCEVEQDDAAVWHIVMTHPIRGRRAMVQTGTLNMESAYRHLFPAPRQPRP